MRFPILSPLAAVIASAAMLSGAGAQGFTRTVSIDDLGEAAQAGSGPTKISADGRFVAFRSAANLDGASSGQQDIYVHDLLLHRTERVSLADDGGFANAWSSNPVISDDGRFVAWVTASSNLVPGDTNGARDVYARDRLLGRTHRVSLGSNGEESKNDAWTQDISADGRFILFSTRTARFHPDGHAANHLYRRDVLTGVTLRVSENSQGDPAGAGSGPGRMTTDGGTVVFASSSGNLGGGSANGKSDIYVRDLSTGVTTRVSDAWNGGEADGNSSGPSISANGRWVAFESNASNLVPGDTNAAKDVFLHDRLTGTTARISHRWDGSETLSDSLKAEISADGSTVVFQSSDGMIVAGDANGTSDVFAYDLASGTASNVNVGSNGVFGDRAGAEADVSADGNRVAFGSAATNLIGGTTRFNGEQYVHDRVPVTPDPLQLAGPTLAAAGDTIHYHWANGAPNASMWFTWSLSNAGRTEFGHAFDLGTPTETLYRAQLDANGGEATAQVLPPAAAGLTVYLEVVAYDGMTIEDSNMITLEVTP